MTLPEAIEQTQPEDLDQYDNKPKSGETRCRTCPLAQHLTKLTGEPVRITQHPPGANDSTHSVYYAAYTLLIDGVVRYPPYTGLFKIPERLWHKVHALDMAAVDMIPAT